MSSRAKRKRARRVAVPPPDIEVVMLPAVEIGDLERVLLPPVRL